jgi:hypothetical protein
MRLPELMESAQANSSHSQPKVFTTISNQHSNWRNIASATPNNQTDNHQGKQSFIFCTF